MTIDEQVLDEAIEDGDGATASSTVTDERDGAATAAFSGAGQSPDPSLKALVRAVLSRIGVVVGAAVAIGLGHDLSRWILVPGAALLGAGVLVVWRRTRQVRKRPTAYLIYVAAIALGVILLRSGQASQELGVPPSVAVFGGLGAVLAGAAALLSIARGSSLVRRRAAVPFELGGLAVILALAWIGLELVGRSAASRSGGLVLLSCAAVGLYVVLSLLSESLVVHVDALATDESGEPVPVRRRAVPDVLVLGSRWWLVVAIALGIVVLGVALLVGWANFNAVVVLALAIALVLLFVAVAADGAADMVAVLVVVSLAWSLAPRTVAFDGAPLAAGQTVLVALGDSYISGEGAPMFYDGTNSKRVNECRRAPSAYAPQLVSADTEPQLSGLVFLACSGAKAAHLDARVQYRNEPVDSPPRLRDNGMWQQGATQLEQLDEVLRAVRPDATNPVDDPAEALRGLVLLSLGGNDAGFGNIASSCVGLGDCSEVVEAWTDDLPLVSTRLERVYAALRGVIGPAVPVLVITYPIPLAASRCDISPMTQSEHTALREFVRRLNGEVEQAAAAAGFATLDVQPAFEGHRICDTDNADDWYLNYIATNPTGGSIEALSNPRNWFHNSFHPNAKGHRAIAGAVADWMAAHRDEIAASAFQTARTPYRAAYLAPEPPRRSELRDAIGSGSCVVSGAGWESDWTACESANALQRLLLPGFLFLVATWVVAFTIVHGYRRVTDRYRQPRPAA